MVNKECDFCGKKGNWINVLRDTQIEKKDGSDLILCDECINNYLNGDYDKIKIKDKMEKKENKLSKSDKKLLKNVELASKIVLKEDADLFKELGIEKIDVPNQENNFEMPKTSTTDVNFGNTTKQVQTGSPDEIEQIINEVKIEWGIRPDTKTWWENYFRDIYNKSIHNIKCENQNCLNHLDEGSFKILCIPCYQKKMEQILNVINKWFTEDLEFQMDLVNDEGSDYIISQKEYQQAKKNLIEYLKHLFEIK